MYSLEELKKLWKQYEDSNSYSVFKDGKWTHTVMEHGKTIKPDGVRCKIQETSNTMSFIEFLENIDGAE
jgi:hypothetical protein